MKVYITSSWINAQAVMLLAKVLTDEGHTVTSFVADNQHEMSVIGQQKDPHGQSVDYDEWVWSPEGNEVFIKDLRSIRLADIIVHIEPAGRDSWATVGMACEMGKKVYGLISKGRKVGIMRKLVIWIKDYKRLLELLAEDDKKAAIAKAKRRAELEENELRREFEQDDKLE